MTSIREVISSNIKITLKNRGLRQKDLCEGLQISQGTVSHWFNGTNSMDIDTLVSICRFLRITPNQILGIDPLDGIDLIPEEKHIIHIRRNLNQFGQTTLDATAEAYSSNPAMNDDDKKVSQAM